MIGIFGLLGLATIATAVLWAGSRWLEASADRLAAGYGVPAIVQGSVIAAVGSSMPELVSVLLATLLHGKFELGVGGVVGSAVFNLLVIPAIAVLAEPGGMETKRDLAFKEALFYMLAVATLLLTFSLAVIYSPVQGPGIRGKVTRLLALFPLIIYGLYAFTQYLDTTEYEESADSSVNRVRAWLRFGVGLAAVVVGVEGLVRAAIGFGEVFGTPAFLWGMTVVAAGSSVPDVFVSVTAAQSDRPSVSLANVLGSNTFDLLVAVPVGVLVAGSLTITFAHIVPMMGFLLAATIVFFAIVRTDMFLSEQEGYGLLGIYGLFLVWLVLESVGATNVVPT
ncbi:MAG: sodium:calcium antiporter [Halolamina sp.]